MIVSAQPVTCLGLRIDNRLNFGLQVSAVCKKAAGKLNALSRFSFQDSFTNFCFKKALVEAFIYSQFNYYPLVWRFCSSTANKKIESIQKTALRFFYNDFSSNYKNLLEKARRPTMEVKCL